MNNTHSKSNPKNKNHPQDQNHEVDEISSLSLLNNNDLRLLSQLDWNVIISKIGKYAYFELTKDELQGPIKGKSVQEIKLFYSLLEKLIGLINEGLYATIYTIFASLDPSNNFEKLLTRLYKGSVLSISELNHLAKNIEGYVSLASSSSFHPTLQQVAIILNFEIDKEKLHLIRKNFIGNLRNFVSAEGEIHYEKHPQLKEPYKELLETESQIRHSLKELIRSPQLEKSLQFDEYDLINDHYVLPIRSDSYRSSFGQIIAHSDSGQTLYVEPFSIRNKCNHRITLLAKIDEIIFSLCRSYCELIRPLHLIFANIRSIFHYLDLGLSKAHFSIANNLTTPQLVDRPLVEMQGLFHPLISNPITNDIYLDEGQSGIVISGPNTGGKSVTLKAITLCHLFLHFGLYLPVRQASVFPYQQIYFFSNDQQDLSQGLSSFSAETKNYLKLLKILESSSPPKNLSLSDNSTDLFSSLIVIDEIFNSTSSEEASALALALFAEIRDLAPTTKIIISTHHHMLKTMIHAEPGYRSSHVGFDFEAERPTYKIIDGTPGSSLALTIFKSWNRRFGRPYRIVQRAQSILDTKTIAYEKLLQEISKKEATLSKLIADNRELKKKLTHEQASTQGQYKLKMQSKLEEFDKKMQETITRAQNLLSQIKKSPIVTVNRNELTRELSKVRQSATLQKEEINEEFNSSLTGIDSDSSASSMTSKISSSNVPPIPAAPNSIIIGEKYYSLSLKSIVTVTQINEKKKSVVIKQGNISLHLPLKDLASANYHGGLGGKSPNSFFFSTVDPSPENSSDEAHKGNVPNSSSTYLDCRGMRLDVFQPLVEQALDKLLLGEIPYVIVIHGHGHGILKNWLRSYLKEHPEFKWEVPEQYRDGATKIFC